MANPQKPPAPPPRLALSWTPERAESLARAVGIEELGERHWKVIALCREEAARVGTPPSLERVSELTGIPTEKLVQLFPDDTLAVLHRIAGVDEDR